jgi:hypothetical protein
LHLKYLLQHGLFVLPELIIPESYNLPAFLIQPNRSLNIIFIPFFMLTTIQFNGKPRFAASEIQNVMTNRVLTPKLVTRKPTAT